MARRGVADVQKFMRHFDASFGVVVARYLTHWDKADSLLYIPLQSFLLAFR